MTLLAGAVWTIVDDDGTGTTGTIWNAAWVAAAKASIEANVHSAANPTIDANDVIDEVVTARGVEASLDARLDAMAAAIADIPAPGSVLAAVGKTNLLLDETFLVWCLGDALAPTSWTLTGFGSSVARCGTGLGDANTKIGDFCAKITRASADTTLSQVVADAVSFPRAYPAFRGVPAGFGAWVRSTGIGGARVYINDGVGTTYSAANVAANTWEWLGVSRTLDAAATTLIVGLINDTNATSAYISGGNCILGDIGGAPTSWTPSPVIYESHHFVISGSAAVVAPKFVWAPHRPGIVKQVFAICGTAPTGASLIIDVNTWDGAAYTSMFTGARVTVSAGIVSGNGEPNTTYARRCLRGGFVGGSGNAGARLSIDVDQVGSGVAGADVSICVRALFPTRFLETIFDFDKVGV